MSFAAIDWARRAKTGSGSAKSVLMFLAARADSNGFCYPSQELLSEETELSLGTITRASKHLVAQGLVKVTKGKRVQGQWRNCEYTLLVTKPQAAVPQDTVPQGTIP